MMKIAARIFLLILFTVKVNAQTSVYHPMPDSIATWCEWGSWGTLYPINEQAVMEMRGDTVINSVTYHKIVATGHRHYAISYYVYFSYEYRGAIRQDTATRKVYWRDPNATGEFLLYDFTLGIGDTTQGYWNPGIVITQIDSVLVGADYRKRWWGYNTNIFDTVFIVEGVGSSRGLYRLDYQYVEYNSVLNNFENGATTFVIDSFMTCPFIAGVSDPGVTQMDITVAPNPSNGAFKIGYKSVETQDVSLEIYDAAGRMMSSSLMTGTSEFIWNSDDGEFSEGIYFIRITTLDETVTKKVVLQK